jgi:hypothetical protein
MATNVLPTQTAAHRATPIKHGEIATWAASSDAVALSSGTAGATTISLGSLFHAATIPIKADVLAAVLTWAGGVAGDPILVKLARITAEGTGGTVNACAPVDSRDSQPDCSSAISARFGAGAPSGRVTLATFAISAANPGTLDLADLLKSVIGKVPVINPNTAEGIEVYIVTGTAGPTTAAKFALTFKFIARPVA